MHQKTKNYCAPVLNFFFGGSTTIYAYALISTKTNLYLPPVFQGHLADFLCLPVLLSLSLSVLRFLTKNDKLELSKLKIFIAFLYVSFLFELILPYFSVRYTSDTLDIIAYGAGGLLYYYAAPKTNN